MIHPQINFQSNRILIVEDNEDDLELTIDALQIRQLTEELDVVRDGAEALDYLFYQNKWSERKSSNPIFILLDLKLPKVSGLEVLKRIRENSSTKMIPVVILSSSRQEKEIAEGYRLGTNAYVVKPVEFKDYMEAVQLLGSFWGTLNVTIHSN
ncbi:MAG: response regulator [Marinilabiliales bacterium]|nr:response regulator [Marinilabiliales bacterium]